MTASLIVAGYELLGGTTNPEYRLAPGFTFGEGEPDQVTIESIYLDGEAVTGERTRNRNMQLPLTVFGTGPAGSAGLSVKVTTLLMAINSSTFTVQWTPDGGLPVVFDCFRATWRRPRNLVKDAAGQTQLILEFQALPFGRSTATQSIATATQVQLDSFDTAPTGGTLDGTNKIEGSGSASVTLAWSSTVRGYQNSTPVSRTIASTNLSTRSSVGVRVRTPSGVSGTPTRLQVDITLTSSGGAASRYTYDSGPFYKYAGSWTLATAAFGSGTVVSGGGVNLAAVTGYTITVTFYVTGGSGSITTNLDDLRSYPTASATTITTHGTQQILPAVVGSARTPANLALTNNPATTFANFLLHTPPGTQDPDAQVLTSLSSASTNQTVSIAAANSYFRGTYTVMLGAQANFAGSGATVTVTITQKISGTSVGSMAFTKTVSPTYLVAMGEITLPLIDVPDENNVTTYDIQVNITAGNDRYTEVMLLDTAGQTVFSDAVFTGSASAYVDEPAAGRSGPAVFASIAGVRTSARSILSFCVLTGGPILLDPGDNKLIAWVSTNAPAVTATYYPRWLDERTV